MYAHIPCSANEFALIDGVASWEKKRKEKESKFLQGAKSDLEKCVSIGNASKGAYSRLTSCMQITGRLEEYNEAIADLWVRDIKCETTSDPVIGTPHMSDS